MTTLINYLATDRVEGRNLILAYGIGLAIGIAVAVGALLALA